MTLLALSMVPFMGFCGYFIRKKTQTAQLENEERWTKAFGHIGDFLANMQLGKILLLEKEYILRFHAELDVALEMQKHTSKLWAINDLVTTVFVMISRFLVLGYGVYAIAHGSMTLAELMLVFSLIGMIYYPIGYFFGMFGSFQKWSVDLEKFYEEFGAIDTEEEDMGDERMSVQGNIAFRNVSFGYSEDRVILKDISFEIRK